MRLSEAELTVLQRRVRGGVKGKSSVQSGHSRASISSLAQTKVQYAVPSPLLLAVTGQLPSGKNQVQLLWRNGKVQRYPNKTFTNWRAKAVLELLEQPRPPAPLSAPIRLTCDYWPGNMIIRDVSGQLDALFSLLVYANILKDDALVYDVTWKRHDVNTKFPKVVMELRPY